MLPSITRILKTMYKFGMVFALLLHIRGVYSIRILNNRNKSCGIQSRFLNNRNKSCGIPSRPLGFFKKFNKVRWYSIKIFYNLKKVFWYSKVYKFRWILSYDAF